MDEESVLAKLMIMRRQLRQLASMGSFDRARVEDNYGDQLIAERVLAALVDLATAINAHVCAAELDEAPIDLRSSFRLAAKTGLIDRSLADLLEPSAGMRNVIVHAYADLDVDRLLAAIPMAIEQYGEYVKQVSRWLLERQNVSGGT